MPLALSSRRPETIHEIRAGFLRFLALGGDDNVPVQEAGLEIYGAYIVGDVDLCRGNCVKKLVLNETHIDGSLQIEDASLGILALQKSYVSGIVGRRSKIDGTLLLDGIQCVGEISLYRAKIGGNVQCSGANLKRNANNFTVLNCYHATIGGDVLLNDGFTAQGGISLQNASIEGCIYCTGGVFNADGDKDKEGNIYTGTALDCSNASIRGDVLLIARGSERFKAKGMVSFHSATIGGKFDCTGGSFDGTTHFCASESKIGTALDCQNTSIKREVVLGDSSSKQGNSVSGGRFEALGTVTFCGANLVAGLNCIGGLFDGATSTGKHLKQFGTSLDCTNSTIKQGAYLGALSSGECFESRGEVSFYGANIDGELYCSGGSFQGFRRIGETDRNSDTREPDYSLRCAYLTVSHGVTLGALLVNTGKWRPFTSIGVVQFDGMNCQGDLNCSGGVFIRSDEFDDGNSSVPAVLSCDNSRCKRIFLSCIWDKSAGFARFKAEGPVSLQGAHIESDLDCSGGQFNNPGGVAIECQGSAVGRCVFLRKAKLGQSMAPFKSSGIVRFTGTSVGLQFDCNGGEFENNRESDTEKGCAALALDLALVNIKDTLHLGVETPKQEQSSREKLNEFFGGSQPGKPAKPGKTGEETEPVRIRGSLRLNGAFARNLIDGGFLGERGDGAGLSRSVPEAGSGRDLRCYVELDGFTYERIAGAGTCNAKFRKEWLQRQPPKHLGEDFRPQPYEQLAKVLRATGFREEADEIAIAKRRCLRKAAPWLVLRVLNLVFMDLFLGYGYRLRQAIFLLFAIGAGFGLYYQVQVADGGIVPADSKTRSTYLRCVEDYGNRAGCARKNEYRSFNPWLYSANIMIPLIDFGMKSSWQPAPDRNDVYFLQTVEIALGWFCGLLVTAVMGFMRRE